MSVYADFPPPPPSPAPHRPPPPPHRPPAPRGRWRQVLLPLLCLLLGFAIYRFWVDRGSPSFEPRPVTARGELAQDEQHTIELFKSNRVSVVFISTIQQRPDLRTRSITEMPAGTGSGFVWDDAGHVVTNFHVVQNASGANVILWDHKQYRADLVGVAPNYDLAVLKINAPASALRPIPIGESANLQVGQKVFAIGNPFGLDQTLTTGVLSALGREINAVTGRPIKDVIQTDAAVNPGNSGGPLLDSAGRLIGVNTAIYSPSGASAGIGFAVPVDTVNRIVPQLLSQGRVIRPYMGVHISEPISQQITRRLNVPGLLVLIVEPGSPAERAGIKPTQRTREGGIVPGDIIQAVDGGAVTNSNELYDALEKRKPGDEVTLKLFREGATREVKVQLQPPAE